MIGGGRNGPPPQWTFPRAYRVQLSNDGINWAAAVAEGEGVPGVTTVAFPPVTAKFVRITQTAASADVPWSVRLLRFYAVPPPSHR
jgi:hypothetical protein